MTEEKLLNLQPWLTVVSQAMDQSGIQDSYSFRAVSLSRALAEMLVDGKGQLHSFQKLYPHFYYPGGASDGSIWEHQSKFLKRWDSDREFVKKFRKFSMPLFHKKAEEMVRATLLLSSTAPLSDADVRRAVICACLTPLRQSVGSCFATAPAILVQGQDLDLLMEDLYELLMTGRLRRVMEGVQYTAPLSLSFGVGDLRNIIDPRKEFWKSPGLIAALETAGFIPSKAPFEQKILRAQDALLPLYQISMTVEQLLKKAVVPSKLEEASLSFKSLTECALLKAWEFTLASFSDIKMEFSGWSLNWSVGLNPEVKGGIGEALYTALDSRLQEANKKAAEYHLAAKEGFDQLQVTERFLKNASTEAEERRLKAEQQARMHHLRVCEELRDESVQRAKTYAEFFPFLIREYAGKFQEYFQEIYDPEMPEIYKGPYEDRMAGFRLVFKHGRHDSSLWTFIYDASQFIKASVEFFTLIEHPLTHACQTAVEKKIVEEMTTITIQHVQTDAFLNAVMAQAKSSKRLPWAYLSGGSVRQLIPLYFRTRSLKQELRQVQDELDLFTFLLEMLKSLPPSRTDRFLKDPTKSLLIESPTHVFALLPGLPFFKEGWIHEGFTYTWIRDQFVLPGKEFYASMQLSSEQQWELLRRLSIEGEVSSSTTVEKFCLKCHQIPVQELAAFLYRTLPLTPIYQCKAVLQRLLEIDNPTIPEHLPDFLSSEEIQQMAKAQIDSDIDRHAKIARRAQELKLAPKACVFADTNWPQGYFAFVVHPISLNLEVWKSDKTGSLAAPLPLFKTWLGKGKEFTWTINFF